jgi:uroporphyrinogen-III synthase
MHGPLDGVTVLVPESRELDLLAGMLEAQGAKAFRCPLVTIKDLEDFSDARAWILRVTDGSFDDLILQTGEGLHRLVELAGDARDQFIGAIGRLRIIVRGPKPVRALRDIGLRPSVTAIQPTSSGIIESLANETLAGRRIALQSYPDAPRLLEDFLVSRGASVDRIVPYAYASDADDESVARAIMMMARGEVGVAAFTSSPQVRRLVDVAKRLSLQEQLSAGLRRTKVAAVGPLVASALETAGATVAIVPENFHLKPMVSEIVKVLAKG